jgi:UbiD family decarboxylase
MQRRRRPDDQVGKEGANVDRDVRYDSLRDWLDQIDQMGELKLVRGASWEEEIGAITDLAQHDESVAALLFDEVPGFPKGYRVLANAFGGKRQNVILGFPAALSKLALSDCFLQEYRDAKSKRVPYQIVESGPVFENVITGNDIDVLKFPTPMWHPGDGGRYIGTGCFNVTRDPDEGWINAGTYRIMIHDRNSVGFYISPGKHGRIHRDKYMARNEPMPVCMVLGVDPLTFLIACSAIPSGTCEFDIVGSYRKRPLQVVKGRFTGLPFPADAEIVLEGFVRPGAVRAEGPFGEWTGYYGSPGDDAPVMEISAIYHRNDPILVGCPPQRPPGESSRSRAILRSALIKEDLQKAGVPDVQSVWAHEVAGARMLVGVSIKQRYPGHARQAGQIAAQCGAGAYAGKYVVVVDEDVDVSNLGDLIGAMAFRSDPARSIDIIHNAWSTGLDPSIPPDQKKQRNFTNSRAVIDACKPFHWKEQFPKMCDPDPAAVARAKEKFGWIFE